MFTGLIETVGAITNIARRAEVTLLEISAPAIAAELKPGDSVAVSGACLTVVRYDAASFTAEMMQETERVTKFSGIKTGTRVNLERAMRADSRFDGHFVAGHVDGTAITAAIEDYGSTRKYTFSTDSALTALMISKGSVAVDGVSLTLIDVADGSFSVGIIPTTLADSTISDLKKGDIVNIETDMIGKYIIKLLKTGTAGRERDGTAKETLTWDKLAEYGWI